MARADGMALLCAAVLLLVTLPAANANACSNRRQFPISVNRNNNQAEAAGLVVARQALGAVRRAVGGGTCRMDDNDRDLVEIERACRNKTGSTYRLQLTAEADYYCRPPGARTWRDTYLRFTAEVEVTRGRYRVISWRQLRVWGEGDEDDWDRK